MLLFNLKDNLCVVRVKIVGFMDNNPWWELENGQRLVKYDDTRHYQTELCVPLIPK